jgi:transposase
MIVIGVDVHKHSLTAVAVDELGRLQGELSTASGNELLVWSKRLVGERLWALEDCRHVSRSLEQTLLTDGERLVRVPPRLTAPQRRGGRTRGKSDTIDALAVARAALREPFLDRPRPEEAPLRELKPLVDHRDDLVAERRRCQQRLRWHLHELNPTHHDTRAELAGAAGLRTLDCRQAALRDRSDRPLPNGCATRSPCRRRAARGQLGQAPAPPPRPRR